MKQARRRFRRRHGDVDDWLMTYTDMITLLVCFFAIFLSVSVPKKDKFKQAREEVREQFGSTTSQVGKFVPQLVPRSFNEEEEIMGYDSMPSIVGHFDDRRGSFKENKQKDGDRMITLEMSSAAFFDSGSATLSEAGKTILVNTIKSTLNDPKYKDYIVTVEGHTDDNPINTPQFPSNWELSTGRASAVVKYFLEQGISPQRLRAAGYADTFPKVANRDASGNPVPFNQAQNRRVVIKLEKLEKDKKE